MKKIIGTLLTLIFMAPLFLQPIQAQNGKWIYEKQIGQRKPAPYPYLREADVMWAKKVWRLIDLREKMNHPFYYPSIPQGDWYSLIDVILGEINSGTVNAYDTNSDQQGNNLTVVITKADIDDKFGAGSDTIMVPDPDNPSILIPTISQKDRNTSDVKQYLVQEVWYFDTKLSSMQVRVLAICPIVMTYNDVTETTEKRQLFWIYYPDFRRTFANHAAFNAHNDAKRISYDDLFLQRRFSSFIYAESNVYNNRQVNSYEVGRAALLESERIKQEIFDFEQDLWEY